MGKEGHVITFLIGNEKVFLLFLDRGDYEKQDKTSPNFNCRYSDGDLRLNDSCV